jgi:hypothetical protein
LFLDPTATHHLKARSSEIGLEAVFTKDFARLNPAKVWPRALSNKIADCSTQYADIKEQENSEKTCLDYHLLPNRLGNGGSDRTRTCDPRLIKAVL